MSLLEYSTGTSSIQIILNILHLFIGLKLKGYLKA